MARRNAKGQFQGRKHHRKHYKGLGRKHRRHGFRGFGALPGLADIKASAGGYDVLLGVGVGLVGAAAARWAINKLNASGMLTLDPAGLVYNGSPLIGAAVAGAVAHAWAKESGKKTGLLVGAVASGLGIVGFEQVLPRVAPGLFGYGLLQPERGMGALIPARQLSDYGREELAQAALGASLEKEDADAIESLL